MGFTSIMSRASPRVCISSPSLFDGLLRSAAIIHKLRARAFMPGATLACSLESHLQREYSGAHYEIALHSSFLFCYYSSYRPNHIHRLRVAGNWQTGIWFTNTDIFCK